MQYVIQYTQYKHSQQPQKPPYSNNPSAATTAPNKDDGTARNDTPVLTVGDADALALADALADDADVAPVAVALAIIDAGAVRIPVGTDEGLRCVGATMMPPAIMEFLALDEPSSLSPLSLLPLPLLLPLMEVELETAAYSPVLRTV